MNYLSSNKYRNHRQLCNTDEEQSRLCPDLDRFRDELDEAAAIERTKEAPNSPIENACRYRNLKRRRSRRRNRPKMLQKRGEKNLCKRIFSKIMIGRNFRKIGEIRLKLVGPNFNRSFF